MEEAKELSNNPSGGSLLRYPLRSAAKSKDVNKGFDEPAISSANRRIRTTPNVAKSTSALAFSGKETCVNPPKRLSNPTMQTSSPNATPRFKTPIMTYARRSRPKPQMGSDTPKSDASSISSTRRKFCTLSSVSYWLAQIKLAESASMHSVAIGFFQLALDSGVEPLLRIREELKSYVLRHKLYDELGNATKTILDGYNILEEFEKLHLSNPSSQLEEEAPHTTDSRNLKPKALNVDPQKKTPASTKKTSVRNPRNAAITNPREVEELNEVGMMDEKENTDGTREEIDAC